MLKLQKFFALCFFIMMCSNSYSQDKTIDSLKVVLQNPKIHDTVKLRAINEVMDRNYTQDDQAYFILNKMRGDLAQKKLKERNSPELKKKYTLWLASYYTALANEYANKQELEKALASSDKSITMFKSVKSYDEMYSAMISKASVYAKFKQDEKAIPLIYAAYKYFEKDKANHIDDLADASSALGYMHFDMNQHEKSITYYDEAIRYYKMAYAKNPSNDLLYVISVNYGNIAFSYSQLKKFDKTIDYCDKGIEISRKIGNPTMTGILLTRKAYAQMQFQKYDEAEKLFKEVLSLKELEMANNDVAIANANTGLADLYVKKKEYAKALPYANKGFFLSKRGGSVPLQTKTAKTIYEISMATKNFERALEMYQFQEKITDSSQIEASKNELEQQQLKYDFEKKELNYKLISEKEKSAKNNWLIALSSLLLLILLGGFFYYRNNRQKQAIAVLEKNQIKQKLLITQMNPHFIFNSIENIRSLIYQNQNNDAVNYLGKFSKLTRQILENSNENYISLEEEVEMTENYLSIQQLLYNNKFNFSIAIAENIDPESVFLPPMLTQPFIENAIKHGLSNTLENGKIDIRFYLNEAKLFFEVSDNGKGFDNSQKLGTHKSLAMTITKERLVTYTKNHDFVVQTDNILGDDKNVVGAKVLFEIPYIYEN